jgi:hypothetical protein
LGLREVPVSLLSILLFGRKFSHPIPGKFEEQIRQWLWFALCRALGWPPVSNRWLYPDIFGWDRDNYGELTIPALISFYPNPQRYIGQEQRAEFRRLLNQLIPGPWFLDWSFISQGYVIAERRPIKAIVEESEREAVFYDLATYEEKGKKHGRRSAGHELARRDED